MSDVDGFPRELIGAPIRVTRNPNNIIVGKTSLYTGALTGDPINAWWDGDVVVVECAGSNSHNYYYYTAANSSNGVFVGDADGCHCCEFQTALERARKYRAEQGGSRGGSSHRSRRNDDYESDDSPMWWKVTKIIFKIIFFPLKAFWWLLKQLNH